MNSYFKSESERSLWIRLNAERIQYHTLKTNKKHQELGDINTPYTPMSISNNQLMFDEAKEIPLRYTFEELLMSDEDLFWLAKEKNDAMLDNLINNFQSTRKIK